jgi:hypothetical protein
MPIVLNALFELLSEELLNLYLDQFKYKSSRE